MPKIVNSGLVHLSQAQAGTAELNIDTFVYANIPGLDFLQEVPGTETMPSPENEVHQSAVANKQYVTDSSVLYSNQLDASVGDFNFNWIGLYDSTAEVLVAVAYVPLQVKWHTTLSRSGNILVKNFAIQYSNMAELADIDINIDPQSNPDFYLVNAANAFIAGQISYHEQKSNPHSVYMTGPETDAKILEHEEKTDPHPQYNNQAVSDLLSEIFAGFLFPFPSAAAIPNGFIAAEGAAISRTTYARVFARLGTLFGAGDGVNTFNLPDARGKFLRGFLNGISAAIGTVQNDAFQNHIHVIRNITWGSNGSTSLIESSVAGIERARPTYSTEYSSDTNGGTIYPVQRTDAETRPVNYAVIWCIKY